MKKILLSLIFILALTINANADYVGCVDQGGTIPLYVFFKASDGTASAATSKEAKIVDSAQATDSTITDGSISQVASETGWYVASLTVGGADPVGMWSVKWKGTVDSVIIGGIDNFEVLASGECTGGGSATDRLLLADTTIATLASQTSFTLNAGSADDNAYNNATIVIEDASTSAQKAIGLISNYTGGSKTVTLLYDPAIFTIATTDKVYILAENALKATLANRQLNVAADGDIGGNVDGSVASLVGHTVQSGDGYLGATAHANLVNQYDTTGLTGDTFPATQQQLSNIALTGATVSTPAKDAPNGFVITSGENEANDEDSTHALDDVTHDLEAINDGGTEKIEAYYEFNIGGDGITTGITAHHYLDKGGGAAKNLTVWAYNWGGTAWDQIGTLTSGTSLETDTYTLFTAHVGAGANVGLVRIRYLTGSVSLTATSKLLVDQIFVEYAIVNRTVGYAAGAIWVDTNASNTNTESFVDGTADNPVSTWAAALTLSGQLNITRFHIANGSAITLTGNSDNYWIVGQGYTLALGGQSIASAFIFGGTVTGTGTGGSTVFEDTPIGDVTLAPSIMRRAFLSGTITNSGAGDWFINHSMSRIAGTSTPVFDFGTSVGDTNLNMRGYSGGIQLESMGDTGTDTASIEGWGQVVEGTNTGGVVHVRGNFTVSGITNLTLHDDARIDVAQINTDIINTIESQRGHHSATGNHFYWGPSGGSDSNDCETPARRCATFAYIQTNKAVANNHDVIHAVADASTAQTVSNEEITISKAYTFLRGPGRDFKIEADTTASDTVTISAEGVEVSGMIVNTAATGAKSAIVVTGDFAYIHDVWVDVAQKYGIELNTSSNSRVHDVTLEDVGGGGSDAAIYIKGTTGGDAMRNMLWNLVIIGADSDGIRIDDSDDTGATDNVIIGNGKGVVIFGSTGWGINEVNGNENHIIGPSVMLHGNASGAYSLTGAGSAAINVDNLALATGLATAQTDLDTITGADGTTLATAQGNYAPIKLTDTVDGTRTVQEVLCAVAATQLGKSSGMGTTTVTFRNIDDDTNVVVGVMDSSFNRTNVTLTLTGCN